MDWYLGVLRKYAVFSGRARRLEYWMFQLINLLVTSALVVADVVMGMANAAGVGFFAGIYALAVFIPELAVCVRRLHDTGRSAWWLLLVFLPLLGALVLFIFMLMDGQRGENRFGPAPKGPPAVAA